MTVVMMYTRNWALQRAGPRSTIPSTSKHVIGSKNVEYKTDLTWPSRVSYTALPRKPNNSCWKFFYLWPTSQNKWVLSVRVIKNLSEMFLIPKLLRGSAQFYRNSAIARLFWQEFWLLSKLTDTYAEKARQIPFRCLTSIEKSAYCL